MRGRREASGLHRQDRDDLNAVYIGLVRQSVCLPTVSIYNKKLVLIFLCHKEPSNNTSGIIITLFVGAYFTMCLALCQGSLHLLIHLI